MYRKTKNGLEIFVGRHGGPFSKTWTIPKGLVGKDEDLFETAKREFGEETGLSVPQGIQFLDLGSIIQKNNKKVFVWAFEDKETHEPAIKSNLSKFGWPELDQAKFFPAVQAKKIIYSSQAEFIERLEKLL